MKAEEYAGLHWSAKAKVIMENLRVIPRALMSMYGYVIWDAYNWYISLPNPTTNQMAFASLIWGASAAWFGLYLGNSKK